MNGSGNKFVICIYEGCGKQPHSRGLCSKHYALAREFDLLDELPRQRAAGAGEPSKFILAHVDYKGTDCLPWPFGRTRRGYGQLAHEGKQWRAHRLMCVLAHGQPPFEKAEATHSCHNGHEGCVNPNHLRWKTHQENIAESAALGRTHRLGRKARPTRSHPDLILE